MIDLYSFSPIRRYLPSNNGFVVFASDGRICKADLCFCQTRICNTIRYRQTLTWEGRDERCDVLIRMSLYVLPRRGIGSESQTVCRQNAFVMRIEACWVLWLIKWLPKPTFNITHPCLVNAVTVAISSRILSDEFFVLAYSAFFPRHEQAHSRLTAAVRPAGSLTKTKRT